VIVSINFSCTPAGTILKLDPVSKST
jgi:hypothetical protein